MKKLKNTLTVLIILISLQSVAQSRFRIALHGGLGYRIAKIADNVSEASRDYIKELKSGYSLELEANYFVQSQWALGLQYSRFNSQGSTIEDIDSDGTGNLVRSGISNNIAINYIGPQYLTKASTEDGMHSLIGSVSFGYLTYRNDNNYEAIGANFELKGDTIGYGIGMGYELRLSDTIALGAKLGVIGGSISEIKISANGREVTSSVEELFDIEREDLTRVDVMAGIRFYL